MRFMGVSVEVHFYCKKVAHQKINFFQCCKMSLVFLKVWMGYTPSFFSAKNTVGYINVYNEIRNLGSVINEFGHVLTAL